MWRWLVLCWGLWLGSAVAQPTATGVLELHTAQARITVDGQTTQERVRLPYIWDRRQPGHAGTAQFDMVFALAGPTDTPYGVYFLRLGNTYEVWVNGALLQRRGDLQGLDDADYAKIPRYISIPAALLQKDNLLRVLVHAHVGRRGGMAAAVVGPESAVLARYQEEADRVDLGFRLLAFWGLFMVTMASLLWWTQTEPSATRPGAVERDRLYLYTALAELFFLLRLGNQLVEQPPLPWAWWNALIVLSLGGWIWCMACALCLVAGWGRRLDAPGVPWLGVALVFSGALAGYAATGWHTTWAMTLWYGLLAVLMLPFGLVYGVTAFQAPRQPYRVAMALALAVNVAMGIRDWVVFHFDERYGQTALLAYSNRLFGLILTLIAISRFHTARVQVRDLIDHMAQRITEKETAVQQLYQHNEELVRAQERAGERTRILRDMHDGVGAHLSTAIRQLQSGKASQAEVLYTLRDSLDHLKLSMDALHLPPGDITALLANLRYRLAPRFAVLDIALEWDVDELPPLHRLDSAALRQLQFMLFEAFSNVLQHAQASVLRIQAKPLGTGGVGLKITDNGRGFDTTQPLRNGLLALHERARTLGVVLTLRSVPGCTEVAIDIP